MADIAHITLIGRLTRNPETQEVKNNSVAKFSLAVSGFKKDEVSFFDCEAWGRVGEIVQEYCEKGKQVAVAGTIRIDRWEDKDGNKRSKPVVNVRDMTLLGSKSDSSSAPKEEKNEVTSDDVPF
jgi:single-strand DNA-binding protein